MAVAIAAVALLVGALMAFRGRNPVLQVLGAVLMVAGGVAFIMGLAIQAPR